MATYPFNIQKLVRPQQPTAPSSTPGQSAAPVNPRMDAINRRLGKRGTPNGGY